MKPNTPIVAREAYTIDEFIAAYRISRAGLYQLWKAGRGPRYRMVGTKRLIGADAAEEWFAAEETRSEVAA
jgi:hypothetical protein